MIAALKLPAASAGLALFGIASFRAGVYPRILCVAVMIGGLVSFGAGLPPYGIPLGLAVPQSGCGVWPIQYAARSRPLVGRQFVQFVLPAHEPIAATARSTNAI